MSRTPIPGHLIHRPAEVGRNADLFDQFCRLVEDTAFPVVQRALARQTIDTGTEVFTNEAKLALEALLEDALVLEGVDEKHAMEEVRKSLGSVISPPNDEECHALARDVAQVLTGTWLETLRSDLSKTPVRVLSEDLLPASLVPEWFAQVWLILSKRQTPHPLSDALAPLAINEDEAHEIMSTLRVRLFSEPRLVNLPFNLMIAGAPGTRSLAMTRAAYEHVLAQIDETRNRARVERRANDQFLPAKSGLDVPRFGTASTRAAVSNISTHLSPLHYFYLNKKASRHV